MNFHKCKALSSIKCNDQSIHKDYVRNNNKTVLLIRRLSLLNLATFQVPVVPVFFFSIFQNNQGQTQRRFSVLSAETDVNECIVPQQFPSRLVLWLVLRLVLRRTQAVENGQWGAELRRERPSRLHPHHSNCFTS